MRCVSKLFKRTIEVIISNDVVQLQINQNVTTNVMCRKSLMLFQTDKMMTICVKDEHIESFFIFISMYCPRLQVLDAWTITTSLDSLLSVAHNLRYFALHDLERSVQYVGQEDEIFAKFPMLEAFDFSWISPYPFCHHKFYYFKQNYNSPVPFHQWVYPCVHSGRCHNLDSKIPSNLKSLTWSNLFVRQPLDISSFDSTLTNCLQFLAVTDLEFHGTTYVTFPNLRFIRIDTSLDLDGIKGIIQVLKYSSRLEYILITTDLDSDSTIKLSTLVASFNQLKYLYLSCPMGRQSNYDAQPLFLPLQPKLIYFCLEFNVPLVLLNSSCLSLQSMTLSVPFSGPIDFNLPNLVEFNITLKQRINNYSSLIESIGRSLNLKYLQIQSHPELNQTSVDYEFISRLSHLLTTLVKLERIHINIDNVTFGGQVNPAERKFDLHHSNLPLLRRLELRIYNLTSCITLCNYFEALEVNEYGFIGKDKVGSFSDIFDVSTFCKISFSEQMTKLKYLRVTSWNALHRIIDGISIYCSCIEAIELLYSTVHSDLEQPQELTSEQIIQCATVIANLPKLTKLEGIFTESFLIHFLTQRSIDFPPFTIEIRSFTQPINPHFFHLQNTWIKSGRLLSINGPCTDA